MSERGADQQDGAPNLPLPSALKCLGPIGVFIGKVLLLLSFFLPSRSASHRIASLVPFPPRVYLFSSESNAGPAPNWTRGREEGRKKEGDTSGGGGDWKEGGKEGRPIVITIIGK